jgi:hypothetical protein
MRAFHRSLKSSSGRKRKKKCDETFVNGSEFAFSAQQWPAHKVLRPGCDRCKKAHFVCVLAGSTDEPPAKRMRTVPGLSVNAPAPNAPAPAAVAPPSPPVDDSFFSFLWGPANDTSRTSPFADYAFTPASITPLSEADTAQPRASTSLEEYNPANAPTPDWLSNSLSQELGELAALCMPKFDICTLYDSQAIKPNRSSRCHHYGVLVRIP